MEINPDDFLSCPVCHEDYDGVERLPKSLPCTHTLCLKCVVLIIRQLGGYFTVDCPECRTCHRLHTGESELPDNVTIKRLMTARAESIYQKCQEQMKGQLGNYAATLEERLSSWQQYLDVCLAASEKVQETLQDAKQEVDTKFRECQETLEQRRLELHGMLDRLADTETTSITKEPREVITRLAETRKRATNLLKERSVLDEDFDTVSKEVEHIRHLELPEVHPCPFERNGLVAFDQDLLAKLKTFGQLNTMGESAGNDEADKRSEDRESTQDKLGIKDLRCREGQPTLVASWPGEKQRDVVVVEGRNVYSVDLYGYDAARLRVKAGSTPTAHLALSFVPKDILVDSRSNVYLLEENSWGHGSLHTMLSFGKHCVNKLGPGCPCAALDTDNFVWVGKSHDSDTLDLRRYQVLRSSGRLCRMSSVQVCFRPDDGGGKLEAMAFWGSRIAFKVGDTIHLAVCDESGSRLLTVDASVCLATCRNRIPALIVNVSMPYKPSKMAASGSRLYVTDAVARAVHVFTLGTDSLPSTEPCHSRSVRCQKTPTDVTVMADGTLLVTCFPRKNIHVFRDW